uniref:Glycoside hydrolase family 5 n=1 Tax=uncultured bacterium contig00026 TaxID=1181515 RepID=A0A806JY30_9BACT|nr:glycoside hydrolase family 5 [uncultured bacterium contig00026]
MKKYSWVAVILLVFPLAFFGCGGNGGDDDDDDITDGEPRIVELGDFTWINNDNPDKQKGWRSNGTDNTTTDLDIADLKAAKYLVLELSSAPTGGLQIVWQGNYNSNWDWNQTDGILASGVPDATKGAALSEDFVLTIELSLALTNYSQLASCTQAKFLLGYFSPDIAGLGITSAYLVIE